MGPARGQIELWARITNFYLRVSQGGGKTWRRELYDSGRRTRQRLGQFPA
jgi:hypothetical protein